jgi:CheY-like chemotaxis protein
METILVVDDEAVVLSICQNILTKLGAYQVVAMTSAQEAARFCENHTSPPIDLALIDVMMPGMNGIELANHIRKERVLPQVWCDPVLPRGIHRSRRVPPVVRPITRDRDEEQDQRNESNCDRADPHVRAWVVPMWKQMEDVKPL